MTISSDKDSDLGQRKRMLRILSFANIVALAESTDKRVRSSAFVWRFIGAAVAFWLPFVLYSLTLARTPVLGDPTEYTYVAHELGIAHPPGYAFITLVGHLFQTIIPFESVAWRMHLLSAVVGTSAGLAVYGTVKQVTGYKLQAISRVPSYFILLTSYFSFLTVTLATNHWQHSIHANPHIITAGFLVINVYLLTKWGVLQDTEAQRHGEAGLQNSALSTQHSALYLYLFSLSTGLGAAHHPLTVFSFPAYIVFILWVRPRIVLEWRTLLGMVGSAAAGLSLFLYYPIRSPQLSAFWPQTMNTWEGFTAHVLARGLSESLPYYSLAEQPIRTVVFWSILRMQFALPVILLAVIGVGYLLREKRLRPFAALILIAFVTNYAFVISLKAQDIMAYIQGPVLLIGILAGVGLFGLVGWLRSRTGGQGGWVIIAAAFLIGPIAQLAFNLPRISLTDYSEGSDHVETVFMYFDGRGDGVVLLNNWEFMTPLWYTRFVEERWPNENDVRPEFVSAAEPWLPSVFNYLPGGPVYINSYRREIVDAGFRLRPRGPFYEVVEPVGEKSLTVPPELEPVVSTGEGIDLLAYELPHAATAGEFVPFTLAMRVPLTTTDFYAPVLQVGDIEYAFTTDTHLITPLWNANEVIVERFDFALPHDLPAGDYPVSIRVQNLSQNEDSGLLNNLGTLRVKAHTNPPNTDGYLANFRQRVGLTSAAVWQGVGRTAAPWAEPLRVQHGDVLNIMLNWEVVAKAEESYTIFVHLNTLDNVPVVALDYTPLGGAVPSHLWIPKWLPGQQMTDPYRMIIDESLPAGTYYIEVGLYEMTSGRRLHRHDESGNLIGDRYILGQVVIE